MIGGMKIFETRTTCFSIFIVHPDAIHTLLFKDSFYSTAELCACIQIFLDAYALASLICKNETIESQKRTHCLLECSKYTVGFGYLPQRFRR